MIFRAKENDLSFRLLANKSNPSQSIILKPIQYSDIEFQHVIRNIEVRSAPSWRIEHLAADRGDTRLMEKLKETLQTRVDVITDTYSVKSGNFILLKIIGTIKFRTSMN
jgi:hypothetical protein